MCGAFIFFTLAFAVTVSDTGSAEQTSATEYFLPGVSWRGYSDTEAFMALWEPDYLQAFKEPSLWIQPKLKDEVYRFTMLPSFYHPLAVRLIVAPDGSGIVISKRLTGKGGYDPGYLDFERSHPVTREQVKKVRRAVDALKFWSLPTEVPSTCLDGANWIFEIHREGRFHSVIRNSPHAGSAYRKLCLQLLRIGNLEEIDAYTRMRPKPH
jgi:hypothetical protein